jgi:hypothetical protein
LLIVAGLAWGGGELHYRNCVDAAESKYPSDWRLEVGSDPLEIERVRKRREAVDDCSRLPW